MQSNVPLVVLDDARPGLAADPPAPAGARRGRESQGAEGRIYPYPLYVPPAVVMQQAPPVPTGLPPIQFWYYCDDPQGYYPYVASCNGAWREVPVTPPGTPKG